MQIKLVPDMYHLNTFHLNKNEGGSEWAGGGAFKKPSQNARKFTKSQL